MIQGMRRKRGLGKFLQEKVGLKEYKENGHSLKGNHNEMHLNEREPSIFREL